MRINHIGRKQVAAVIDTGIEEPGYRGRLKPGSVSCQEYDGGTLKECGCVHGIRTLLADVDASGKKIVTDDYAIQIKHKTSLAEDTPAATLYLDALRQQADLGMYPVLITNVPIGGGLRELLQEEGKALVLWRPVAIGYHEKVAALDLWARTQFTITTPRVSLLTSKTVASWTFCPEK